MADDAYLDNHASRLTFIRRRLHVLGPVIGAEAAIACGRRDLLRLTAFLFGWLVWVPATTWAQMAGGPGPWTIAALAGAFGLGIFAASMVFGHLAIAAANQHVGSQLGYPVRLGSALSLRAWQQAIEREKHFHALGRRPKFFIYRAPDQ